MTSADVRIGASASDAIRALLTGPPVAVEVLAVFPAAVYLSHRDGIVALVARDGIHHPNAVAVRATTAQRPFAGITVGMPGWAGGQAIELGGVRLEIGRWWRARPALTHLTTARLRPAADELGRLLDTTAPPLPPTLAVPLAGLGDALARDDDSDAHTQAAALVGLGPGLTPSGDDLLAGLLSARALLAPTNGGTSERVGAAVVARARTATTAISAALLGHAVVGEVSDVAARVLAALDRPHTLAPAVRDLLAVGATSGRDLAVGMLAGIRLADDLTDRATIPLSYIPEEAS